MGIKNFFTWFRNSEIFSDSVLKYIPSHTDHILIDMNGIIHEAAQKIYKYGKYEQEVSINLPKRLQIYLSKPTANETTEHLQKLETQLFEDVKNQINNILKIVIPTKTVFLAVDGVAPKSKQNQQRQRRFRAAHERTPDSFDSVCITAGTDFMQRLSDYISDKSWLNISTDVKYIFSSHNIPGEGEHKLIEWIKSYDQGQEAFTVVGLDADLILLCMCLDKTNLYILREKEYIGRYDWIDINIARQNLERKNMKVTDILVWSCFLGNDFLPPIPSLEIKESFPEPGAFEFFFDNYEKPLIIHTTSGHILNFEEIKRLLTILAGREQGIMNARLIEEKYSYMKNRAGKPVTRFPNDLWKGDIEKYRKEYFTTKLMATCTDKETTQEKAVCMFLKTVYWVYLYYTKCTKLDWDWFYPYNYTLHAADFVEHMKENYEFIFDTSSTPCHHHDQLLRVVPPQSKNILPEFLREKLDEINKNNVYKVDYAGKRFEWEAITIVNNV